MNTELDQYFHELKHTTSPARIEELASCIWRIWLQSGNSQVDEWMNQGCKCLHHQKYDLALGYFDDIINIMPNYAEGWNKRATTYYLRGEYKKSIADIKETLAREPRHFGALSGWATICLILNDKLHALQAFEQLIDIYPHKNGLDNKIKMLRTAMAMEGN